MGRKPKRKLFAVEGLLSWEREVPREVNCEFAGDTRCTLADRLLVPAWAGLAELQEEEMRMAKIKADLLSELIGVCECFIGRPWTYAFPSGDDHAKRV